jgi:dTDP-4-dehydrorhamnose 3,5-epimerase
LKLIPQVLDGIFILEPDLFADERGIFRRHFCKQELSEVGVEFDVAQGNISENFKKHTLRGFHYSELPSKEQKILSCVAGRAWNVTIDVRPGSPTYLQKMAFEISAKNRKSILVPAGCANAFLTLEDQTIFHYYMGEYYGLASDSGFRFDDPQFSVEWPHEPEIISQKDLSLPHYFVHRT